MSILDQVVDTAKSAFGDKVATNPLAKLFIEYLQKPETGGLPGLVQKFEAAGLGAQIQSWIGTGAKLPITPEQVTSAIGTTDIAQMATKVGLPTELVTKQLADLLPETVNHLTPAGKIPAAEKLGELFTSFKAKFGM